MRSVICVSLCLVFATAALASQPTADVKAPSEPQAYCVNARAAFYPYAGEPCKAGYQLGQGNCIRADGRWVAVARSLCRIMAGRVVLPYPPTLNEYGDPQVLRPRF